MKPKHQDKKEEEKKELEKHDERLIKKLEKKFKKRERWYKTVIVILVIIIIILLFRFRCPALGTISVRSGQEIVPKEQCNRTTYDSSQFSFDHSDCYFKKTDEEDVNQAIKRVVLWTKDELKKRIVVTMSQENVKSIDEIPSVQKRRLPGAGYAESPITVDGRKGLKFEKYNAEEKEITIFFYKGGESLAASVFSYYELPLKEDYQLLQDTLVWKAAK